MFLAVALTRLPALIILAAGVALIVGPGVFTLARTRSGGLFAAIAAWGLFLPAWAAWARHDGHPWSARMVAALAIPAAVLYFGTLGPALAWARREEDAAERRRRSAEARKLGEWDDLVGQYAGEGAVRALAVERVRSGRNVALELSGRATIGSLRQAAEHLAVALKLKPGAVTFTPGRHAGEVTMHLDETDALAEVLPFPEQGGPRSVAEPVPLGLYPDGSAMEVLLDQFGIFVMGTTGSGKSNLLNVLIAILSRCEDAVVWVIDTKGNPVSPLAAPWIRPWVEGRAGDPGAAPIDWVATTRTEAHVMLTALLAVIRARAGTQRRGSRLHPAPGLPALYVIVDEVADLTAPFGRIEEGPSAAEFAGLFVEITRKQRSEACPPVLATQRGTTDFTGRTAIKANCRLRFSMAVADRHEARSVTDDPAIADLLASAEHSGSVVIERPGWRHPVLGRLYRLDPDFPEDAEKIERLAVAVGGRRCDLDARAKAAMGRDYADRWERSAMYQAMLGEYHARTGRAPIAPEPGAEVQAAVAEMDVDGAFRALMTGAVVDKATGSVVGEMGMGPGKDSGGPRARMWALLAEGSRTQPTFGVGASVIVSRVHHETGTAKGTVYRWLREEAAAGRLRRLGDPDNDRKARYLVVTPDVPPGDATV